LSSLSSSVCVRESLKSDHLGLPPVCSWRPALCSHRFASIMTITGPLILLSPAKTLNFQRSLTAALAAATPTQPCMLKQTAELTAVLGKMSKTQVKSLMGLSDSLAALNHDRFQSFSQQSTRTAIAAFEGMAYKGLDAPSLAPEGLDYLQSHLRILCGLYGVLRPYDEIRPYRLEMSTKLSVGEASNLYAYWGNMLTEAIDDEAAEWVLNCASAEYAKSINFKSLQAPVITAVFPGPAVHAKQARGELARFCAERSVTKPEELMAFTGANGAWNYVAEASDASTYTFNRGAPKPATKSSSSAGSKRKVAADDAEEAAPPADGSSRRVKRK